MVQINFALREVNCKIVYYGPGRSGKTTNLEIVHAKAPKDSRGEMVSIATETDRTLFFDFLPLNLGTVAGMKTKFQLYTVPGQVYYDATRKLVLQGADGVIFVADSQKSMREENIESLDNLAKNLAENGINISEIPLILQWNKRDLEDVDTPEYLNEYLNRYNSPSFEAVAVKGDGVFPTLKSLASLVIKQINNAQNLESTDVQPKLQKKEVLPSPEKVDGEKNIAKTETSTSMPPISSINKSKVEEKSNAEKLASEKPPIEKVEAGKTKNENTEVSSVTKIENPREPQPNIPVVEKDGQPKSKKIKSEETTIKTKSVSPKKALNPIAAELEKKKAEREEQEKQRTERIKKNARRPAGTTDWKKIIILAGLFVVILAAILAAIYFTKN